MKLLITGTTGFIGSNLVKLLLKNHNTIVYGVSRVNNSFNSKQFVPLKIDLSTPGWTEKLPDDIDLVIHLAQSREYKNFPQGAKDIFTINVASTLQLLDWSRKHSVKQFIFASTGNVYVQKKEELTEEDLCEPNSFYAASKYAAELLCRQYANFFNITILRLFGVYGPGQKDALIPTLREKIKTNQNIEVAGDVGLYLTPLFINDCIKMFHKIIKHSRKEKKVEVYNLSGDEILSLKQMAITIGKKLIKKVIFSSTRNSSPNFLGSNHLFKSRFVYKDPLTSFESGVDECV